MKRSYENHQFSFKINRSTIRLSWTFESNGRKSPGLGDDAAPEQDADATAKPHPSGLQFSGFFEMEIWIGWWFQWFPHQFPTKTEQPQKVCVCWNKPHILMMKQRPNSEKHEAKPRREAMLWSLHRKGCGVFCSAICCTLCRCHVYLLFVTFLRSVMSDYVKSDDPNLLKLRCDEIWSDWTSGGIWCSIIWWSEVLCGLMVLLWLNGYSVLPLSWNNQLRRSVKSGKNLRNFQVASTLMDATNISTNLK